MDSNKAIWNHVLKHISTEAGLSTATFSIWFQDLQLERLTDNYAYLSADLEYKSKFVFSRFYSQLQNHIFTVLGARCEIIIFTRDIHAGKIQEIIDQHIESGVLPEGVLSKEIPSDDFKKEPSLTTEEKKMVQNTAEQKPMGTIINTEIPATRGADYTFKNFIVGDANRMAHEACLAVAKNPAECWNPLYIYAPSGMGKTHLLFAISNEIIKHNPSKRILYVRGEDFANELIDQLMTKKPMHFFRERYRNVDVLLVDDVQFFAGKESSQHEFFHTFDTLYQLHKQIILTSDCPPKELKRLDERLRTRFESGLTVDIQPPELELRVAIAASKAEALGLEIPEDVLLYIANNIKSSIRQLEGVVKRLHGYSTIFGKAIDLDLAKNCIQDLVPKKSVDSIVEKTFEKICEKYNVTIQDLTGKSRKANIVIARHISIYIFSQLTDLSSVEIARYFSQDHSTILSAEKNVEKKIESSPDFEDEITRLIREITE